MPPPTGEREQEVNAYKIEKILLACLKLEKVRGKARTLSILQTKKLILLEQFDILFEEVYSLHN